ncbi:site-specific integrase [uncultured Roseobacter sp.]|uniref:tyrosine-type recombinase/integrase n=1 Tax=uncultured Roseobacter sp. TaxID=114847 RepID=UPI002627FDE3|nr:site-specific integrase [uncultured Roseobacter sp.]
MVKFNPENERIKRNYTRDLREADGYDDSTIDKALAAIHRFEETTRFKPFKKFHIDQAVKFKEVMYSARNAKSGKPLGASTVDSTLRAVKKFFHWLVGKPGFKKVLTYADVRYFNNTKKRTRVAHTSREVPYPTVKAAAHAFHAMPNRTAFEKRDKALFAFFMLTGARVGAVASLRIKHVNLARGHVFQDARVVNTKAAKTINTYFFPVEAAYLDCLTAWLTFLNDEMLRGPEDALFPKAQVPVVKGKGFSDPVLTREPYATTSKLNEIIRTAFSNVQLHPYTPHSFRKTLAMEMDRFCDTMEERKAWSMNLGHEKLAVTVGSYMQVNGQRQEELMRKFKSG